MAKSKLSAHQWAKVQARYEAGDKITIIAKDYGLKAPAIYMRARRKGWKKHGSLREEVIAGAREKTVEKLKESFAAEVEKANERHSNMYKLAEKAAVQYLQQLVKDNEDAIARNQPIAFGNKPYLLQTTIAGMNMAVNGERQVKGYDEHKLEKEDPDRSLWDSLDEKRRERGHIDADGNVIRREPAPEIDTPDVEIDVEVSDV